METKKLIKTKKGATIKDAMLVLLLAIGAFGIWFSFVADNASNSGVAFNNEYNDTYNNLTAKQTQVYNLIDDLSTSAKNVTEAKIGDFAFFGLRGILTLMQLPLVLPGIASDAWQMISVLLPIPVGIKFMILTGILVTIIFAVIKFMTSRGTDA